SHLLQSDAPPPHITTLSLHDALPILVKRGPLFGSKVRVAFRIVGHSKPDFCRDQVVRFEARLHLKNVLEAADQKTCADQEHERKDRKSTRLNSSHRTNSYAVFCLKKK